MSLTIFKKIWSFFRFSVQILESKINISTSSILQHLLHHQFDPHLPDMTFHPSIALHFDQGFILSNLVAIGHSWAIWLLVDLSWPLYDLWTQHCTSLWSGVHSTKFGCHRAFLNSFTPSWPQLTLNDLWPQKYITLQSGVLPTNFDSHRVFLKQLELWMTFALRWDRFMGPSPTLMSSFSSTPQSTMKHIAVHTHTHTPTHPHIQTSFYRFEQIMQTPELICAYPNSSQHQFCHIGSELYKSFGMLQLVVYFES